MSIDFHKLDDGEMSMDLYFLYTSTISLIPTSIGRESFTKDHDDLMRKLLNIHDYKVISVALDEWYQNYKKEHNYF